MKCREVIERKTLDEETQIKIINVENVVKIKKMNSKKIIKTIQTKVDEMTSVRQLSSDDIRVHIKFKKAKIELQKSEK